MRPGSCITTLIHFREFPAGSAWVLSGRCAAPGILGSCFSGRPLSGSGDPGGGAFPLRLPSSTKPEACECGIKAVSHSRGGANTTGVDTIAMLFMIWDVETLLRFA